MCYVLGANPPFHVVEGFVQRIWNAETIDKVGTVAKGIHLIRLKTKVDLE